MEKLPSDLNHYQADLLAYPPVPIIWVELEQLLLLVGRQDEDLDLEWPILC